MDFAYFETNYRLIAADLSKQKALDADSRTNQQIIFIDKIKAAAHHTRIIIHFITLLYIIILLYTLLHSWTIKRNNARIFQRNNKSFVTTYEWLNIVK